MKFKPTSKPQHVQRHNQRRREQRGLAHIEIPLCVQRDIILESDKVFASNMRSALHRRRQGKITAAMFNHIRNFNITDAMRRAQVSFGMAQRLVTAG